MFYTLALQFSVYIVAISFLFPKSLQIRESAYETNYQVVLEKSH